VSKPKAPKEDASTIAMRERQVADLSRLDEEENSRIKQLLIGQRGGRFFRGSPLMRAAPSDRAGAATSGGGITRPAGGAGGNLYAGSLGSYYGGGARQPTRQYGAY
jgi:hypothetical protein